jgi:hypothetical protein
LLPLRAKPSASALDETRAACGRIIPRESRE